MIHPKTIREIKGELESYRENNEEIHQGWQFTNGVAFELQWEQGDRPTQEACVLISPQNAPEYSPPSRVWRKPLNECGEMYDRIDEQLGVVIDGVFRDSIHQSPVEHFKYIDEWSSDTLHYYVADVVVDR